MKNTKPTGRTLDMTKGSPMKLLFTFALPLFLGNLLQQFYNLADTSIAGHLLGDAALAQIGATSALYSLITNFAFGLNNGLALNVSRSFGAGDKKEMKRSVCWMVTLAFISALVMTVGFLMFRKPLLTVMQTPEDVLDGALSYFTVILAGIPLTMAYNLESALLQSMGNSVTPLGFLLFSSILNVILDFFFIGNPLNLGVQGAAAATVLSQGLSAALGFLYILKNYPEIRFGRKDWKVPGKFVAEMFWTGLSMALMSAIYNLGSVILQSSINALGSVYIAAQVGGRKLAEFFYIPGIALGTSAATFSSRKRRQERHFHVFLLVAGGPGFCDFPGPHSGKIHHRQQQSGGNQKRSPLFKNQYSNDSPHGNPGDLKKYSPGHAPAGNAPFLQLSGADRKGDFRPLARSGLRLPRRLHLRASHLGDLLRGHCGGCLCHPR